MDGHFVNAVWPLAKVSTPVSRSLVARPRLVTQVETAVRSGQVCLIIAPGGAGKTSLAASWARQTENPTAWYTIDKADRDTRRLTAGLCAAVNHVLPGFADAALAALDAGVQEAAAVGLLLGAIEGQRMAWVLDDLHHLDDLSEAVALWDHLLRFRPPTLSLIILSRSVPLLGFAALAALDEVIGLGREDLRFDDREATTLLEAHGLDSATAPTLVKRSDGWAAGLLLFAHASPNGMRFLRARADALLDHLGGEILDALPAELRLFILESAAIGPATAPETDLILGFEQSAARYADVAAHGLFLEMDGDAFHYRDFFAEYLVGVLRAERPDHLRAIRRNAAVHWMEQGDLPRALALLAADKDWAELARAIEAQEAILWARGQWGAALAHLEHLPTSYHTPRLLNLRARARLQRGEHAQALRLADSGMAHSDDDDEWLTSAVLRAKALVQAGRYADAIRAVEAALPVAEQIQREEAVTSLYEVRGMARLRLGAYVDGRADLLLALETHRRTRDEVGEGYALYNLAAYAVEAGHADDADGYLTQAVHLWKRLGDTTMLGGLQNTRAVVYILRGDLKAARAEAEQALALVRDEGHTYFECSVLTTLAEIAADGGSAAATEKQGAIAAEIAARLDLPGTLNDALRTRISAALLRRDRSGALRLIDEARSLAITSIDVALLDFYEGLLSLRLQSFTRASSLLESAAQSLEKLYRPHQAARAYLLLAEVLVQDGAVRRAEDALNRMADLTLSRGCEGCLHGVARYAHHVLARRRDLRRLRRDTRLLLQKLDGGPALVVLPSLDAAKPEPLPVLRLSPFGQGHLTLDGRNVALTTLAPKAREVLFYVAWAGGPVQRDTLLEEVWDDDERGEQGLWEATRHLRRLLGEQSWAARGGYALCLPIHDDGRRFLDAVSDALGEGPPLERLAAAEKALALFGDGGYLEWCDSGWVAIERVRVVGLAISVALTTVDIYDLLGRVDDAVAACRRAVAFDDLDERPRRALINVLSGAGKVRDALLEYKAYRRRLREELDEEPSLDLRRLVATLRVKS